MFHNKINKLPTSKDINTVKEAQERINNHNWLKHSQKIALIVLTTIKNKKISQKELAEKMNLSYNYVTKIIKGKERLSSEIISKLEKTLNISFQNI